MALLKIDNVRFTGISACVPENIERNEDYGLLSKSAIEEFIATTGIKQKRKANSKTCTSDLCIAAAEKLISDLKWDKAEIEIVVFVSQSLDYILPISSAIIQDKLGLSKECIALDIPLGCSGYTYGISVIASMMSTGKLKKGLLLVGDVLSKLVSVNDKSTYPLFGDAGSATAFEYSIDAAPLFFHLGTDGSGYKAIIIPDGGGRNPVTNNSLAEKQVENGISRTNCHIALDGMDVFSFGITQAPKTVKQLIEGYNLDKESVDYFVFHQANMMMNKMIAKKLKLPEEKVPYSLEKFGNTSSASIPITIVSELKDMLDAGGRRKLIMCGFGVGLSWATLYAELDNVHCSDIIEYAG